MSIDFGMPRDEADFEEAVFGGAPPVKLLVQSYRCPAGHVNDIVWTAPDIAIACAVNDLRFYCPDCGASRFSSEAEARSLLAAFGLAPCLRIYSS